MDGNKRTALYLVELLIQKSGYRLEEDDDALVDILSTSHAVMSTTVRLRPGSGGAWSEYPMLIGVEATVSWMLAFRP